MRCWLLSLVCLFGISPTPAGAQPIIVDHTSLPLFDQIPEHYLVAAQNMAMMFVNESVGGNISDGLTCLTHASQALAPSSCKRFRHVVPQFSSPESEVSWSRPGGYPRANWDYYFWPRPGTDGLPCGSSTGLWYNNLECFIRYVDANPTRYQVYSYMNSYLQVDARSDIASSTTGYFARQPNRFDIFDFEAMEARHPSRIFVHHTTSLARAIGSLVSRDFNNQMREYVSANNKILLDVADILSHDPHGQPCYDNRDGVPYSNGNNTENHPDDGLDIPAICQHYTSETEGGHLGNPDVARIRVAKGFWILMARIAGWNPGPTDGGRPLPPQNLRIVRD